MTVSFQGKPWMPMLTVCPQQPDLRAVLAYLLPRHLGSLPRAFLEEARTLATIDAMKERESRHQRAKGGPGVSDARYFDWCRGGAGAVEAGSDGCRLVAFLWQLFRNVKRVEVHRSNH